jgi:hypothetical protein
MMAVAPNVLRDDAVVNASDDFEQALARKVAIH